MKFIVQTALWVLFGIFLDIAGLSISSGWPFLAIWATALALCVNMVAW